MAIDPTRLDDFAGIDEVVSNQRVRAYRKGTAYGVVSDPNATQSGVLWMTGTGTVTSLAAGSVTITATQYGGGIIVFAAGAGQTLTLDTATNMLTYANNNSAGVQVGDLWQCLFINGSATNSFILAAGSGGTPDPNQPTITIPANSSKTATIKFTNITTPAYVIYA